MLDLYLEIYLGPLGLEDGCIRLLDERPNLYHRTKGEGNVLLFKLDSFDCVKDFLNALEGGAVLKDFGNRLIKVDFEKLLIQKPKKGEKKRGKTKKNASRS